MHALKKKEEKAIGHFSLQSVIIKKRGFARRPYPLKGGLKRFTMTINLKDKRQVIKIYI